jgi:3-oxosteroid 1-dehydrogenase
MAAEAGARLDRMDQANIYPCLPTSYEGRPAGLPITFTADKHCILVNRHGRRFVNEKDFNIGERIDERDPRTGSPLNLPVWLIGDSRFPKQSLPFLWFARKDKDFVIRAATLSELARKIGLSPETLCDTVARYNRFCDEGTDRDFRSGQSAWDAYKSGGAGAAMHKVSEAPFVAVEVSRSILGTKGGARTDERGRVLRADGSVIDGLYAAGLAMANPFGTRAFGAGTTLGPNLTWGFICAEAVLERAAKLGSVGPR